MADNRSYFVWEKYVLSVDISAAILANEMALLRIGEIYAWALGYLSTHCVPNNTIST
jgi:hypothetical protein